MKRSMGNFLPIFLFLSFFYIDVHPQARLLGIWNNLTKGSNKGSSRAANVSIKGTDFREIHGTPFATNQPLKLPQTINLKFANKEYSIKIEEPADRGDFPGNSNPVRARILGETTDAQQQDVCVTNAISRGIIGREVYGFQNVMLFIDDNPKYIVNVNYPFRFGLSAWTSNKSPWNRTTIENPADDQNTTFAQPLKVIQGHAAFGGGLAPRMGHASITHIYNNTPNILQLSRNSSDTELAKYNFKQLVPPYSAIPFAMIWIPKNTSSKNYINLFVLRAPKKATDLPPMNFSTISEAGTYELTPTVPEVEDLINQFTQSTPNNISDILGDKSYDDLMKSKTDQYFIGKNYFKIVTDAKTNEINVQQIPLGKDTGSTIQKIGPACKGNFPDYFKLTVNVDKTNTIPTLKSIPEEIEVNDFN